MPLSVLPLGAPVTLLNGVIYALPAKRVRLSTGGAAATLVMSNDPTMATSTAVVLTVGEVEVAGGFIKSTGGDVPVFAKPS